MMAPLAYYYPDNDNTWNIKDQFMFGESMMVCPVLKYKARSRKVYFPAGEWVNFWNGEKYMGKQTLNFDAPIQRLPLFVKAGAIIPFGPKVQFATQKVDKPITLKIYPGADGKFTYYQDDNTSYGYEKGDYSEIHMQYTDADRKLTIQGNKGRYIDFGKNPKRFKVKLIGTKLEKQIIYKGKKMKLTF